MDIIIQAYAHKWVNVAWSVYFVLCLILLFYKRKNWKNGYHMFFGLAVGSSVLFFFPVFAELMIRFFLPTYLEYERVSWLFFTVPVMAYVFVQLLYSFPEKRKRILFAVVAFAVVLLVGDFEQAKAVVAPENIYKIDNDAVQAADLIEADKEEDTRASVMIQVFSTEYFSSTDMSEEGELYYGIRQYASDLELDIAVIPKEAYGAGQEDEMQVDGEVYGLVEVAGDGEDEFDITQYCHNRAKYFICSQNKVLEEAVQGLGYEKLGTTDHYAVYKNTAHLTLYLVRHGQSEANVEGRLGGDPHLTEEGRECARELGEALSDIRFHNAYCSGLVRTWETAEGVLGENKAWQDDGHELIVAGDLRDISFGAAEGMLREEAEQIYGEYSEDAYFGTLTDDSFVSPIDGETKYEFLQRFNYAMQWIVDCNAEENQGNILVVSHSAAAFWLQYIFDEPGYANLDNTSVTILSYDAGDWTMEDFNDIELMK